jgi:hypothetical protein
MLIGLVIMFSAGFIAGRICASFDSNDSEII